MILVTGFGPFPGVARNPSAELARAVDGHRVLGEPVLGHVLPVHYHAGPDEAVAWAAANQARWVIGLGVATQRRGVWVERVATRACVGRPDAAGWCAEVAGEGPEHVVATVDCDALAAALGGRVSDDAGAYVCNAWLYRVTLALPAARVGFIHLPADPIPPERLLRGLAAMVAAGR